jgi:hypothetical protein
MRWASVFIAASLAATAAHAQMTSGTDYVTWMVTPVIVGQTSTQVLPARARRNLAFSNVSKTEAVACRLDSFNASGQPNGDPADLTGPGSFVIPASSGYTFPRPVPNNAVNCMATSSGVSFTVME